MRMRKKKNLEQRISAREELLCKLPEECFENPSAAFGNPKNSERPLRLEIGCGKGGFICQCAEQNPDINFYAFEKVSNVIVNAIEKAEAAQLGNVKFIIGDAKDLSKWFPPHSIERIYINFCDPWPKARHMKNRLTHSGFLDIYRGLLREGGDLWFKTDNELLFDFSLIQFKNAGYKIVMSTRDLHASEFAEENIMTEYEKNFTALGMKIFSARVTPISR